MCNSITMRSGAGGVGTEFSNRPIVPSQQSPRIPVRAEYLFTPLLFVGFFIVC